MCVCVCAHMWEKESVSVKELNVLGNMIFSNIKFISIR